MEGVATLAALAAVAVLAILVLSIAKRGASAINLDFFTETPKPFSFVPEPAGIANAIVGTAILVALAAVMAVPVAVLTAIYLNEFAPRRVAAAVSLALDVLNGIPAVVIGIFVFGLLVLSRQQSGFAGGFALAILMLPLVARATQEVLALVPQSSREASLGLGVTRWRTTIGVVLPQTIGGIVTGTTLAVARVAGETAPLLFTSSLAGTAVGTDPQRAARVDPGDDLLLLGVARPERPRAGLGGRARAHHLRAHRRARSRGCSRCAAGGAWASASRTPGVGQSPARGELRSVARSELEDARWEAHLEAALFCLGAGLLLGMLGASSLVREWLLVGLHGWVWFVVAIPLLLLMTAFLAGASRAALRSLLAVVVAANFFGLGLLIAALLNAGARELTGGQLLLSGPVLWLTNVIVFGLLFWALDAGGAIERARRGRAQPDFAFPQDQNPDLARPGWYPRLADYAYVALTNGIGVQPDRRPAADPPREGPDGGRLGHLRGRDPPRRSARRGHPRQLRPALRRRPGATRR